MTDWYPGAEGNPIPTPTYPVRPVPVLDGVRRSLGKKRRGIWTDLRNGALNMWAASGLFFDPEPAAIPIGENPPYEPDQAGAILLGRNDAQQTSGFGGFSPAWGCGYATFGELEENFTWKQNQWPTTRELIAHEVGHALGFWHGGTGVMAGFLKVSEEEVSVAHDFYAA